MRERKPHRELSNDQLVMQPKMDHHAMQILHFYHLQLAGQLQIGQIYPMIHQKNIHHTDKHERLVRTAHMISHLICMSQ